ncbi:MAG: helix-turn-helix domain-containing protein [Angelakisella sp.]
MNAKNERAPVVDTHVSEIVDNLIDRIMEDQDISSMSRREKIALIDTMEQKGVFLMKGAVEKNGNFQGYHLQLYRRYPFKGISVGNRRVPLF